jgi:hypothetical protein
MLVAYLNSWAAGEPAPPYVAVWYKVIAMSLAFAILASGGGPRTKVPSRLRHWFENKAMIQ